MNKFDVGAVVWTLSKDRKAITRTRVEVVTITMSRYGTDVYYNLGIGKQNYGPDVPENRVFANHTEARTALDKAMKHG